MNKRKKKAVIAVSGGVDSAVAALLLKKAGYEPIGVFMRLGAGSDDGENAARLVCQKLNIKFYPINLIGQFKKNVVKYFLDEYGQGTTPNPCVRCNKLIKFNELLRITAELGAQYLATGHYSRNVERITHNAKSVYKLYRGNDKNKDQSYFLYNLTQNQLAHILFPLGDYTKTEVKKIADKAGLPYLKKESQDICFLQGDHNDFLRQHLKLKPGPIKVLLPLAKGEVERGSKFIGEHQGLPLYTIGQRRGVEIGGIGPFYVAKTDYKTNTLFVVSDRDDPVLYQDEFIIKDVNWISGAEPVMPFSCETVIRYRHKPVKCKIIKFKDESCKVNSCGNKYLIKFNEAQRAVTPGQSAVFYKGNELLGGGVIE